MKDITAIILLAGNSTRMGLDINKAFLDLGNKKVVNHSIDKLTKIERIAKIILVYNEKDLALVNKLLKQYPEDNLSIVLGGDTRNESVNNALKKVDTNFCLIHDAARPYTSSEDIYKLINDLDNYDAVSLYHNVIDAIKLNGKSLDKNALKAVTTPQGFNRKAYTYLLNNPNSKAFDELEILETKDFKIGYILESCDNKKITYKTDIESDLYKVGHSLDFHVFEPKDYLLLAGVKIESAFGLKGHSDADVVYHALTEAIFGALHLNDLGTNYPDNDPKYKNYDSSKFLEDAFNKLKEAKYQIANIDIMIYLEKPKLKQYKKQMEENISKILNINSNLVSIKATTYEEQGLIGSKEGIACDAYVLIKRVL